MSNKQESEVLGVKLLMKSLVAEAEAEVEFTNVMDSLSDIRYEYMNGSEKEQVAFIAAMSIFMMELQIQV